MMYYASDGIPSRWWVWTLGSVVAVGDVDGVKGSPSGPSGASRAAVSLDAGDEPSHSVYSRASGSQVPVVDVLSDGMAITSRRVSYAV
jgi:hypothetical protein